MINSSFRIILREIIIFIFFTLIIVKNLTVIKTLASHIPILYYIFYTSFNTFIKIILR